ncbi:hypothetical protein HNQ93_001630 [Hymenobacter luteus]|uniref:Uncharacterized protein n=2 Tax=Hymenobacter TaxID=89966 RepID=A0A7W9T0X5_9BACT|nr:MULTISPECIES: hypothetical protein [Hymenobacter]MBB4601009.1 hypothetical protein [Hymenobacter latericoloratus]MBB6058784.1 hypothetical protein [Hymenobacter luteus]
MRNSPPCLPLTALEKFRPWYTFSFVGQTLPDYFTVQNIRIVTRQFEHEPNLDRGMRVQFAPGSNYTSFIQLYDRLSEVKAGKHWLDITHEPTTFYTYTEKPLIEAENQNADIEIWRCGCCDAYVSPTTFIGNLEALFRFLTEAFLSPDWRNTWLLLLLISLLSGWRVVRQWRRGAAQNIGA